MQQLALKRFKPDKVTIGQQFTAKDGTTYVVSQIRVPATNIVRLQTKVAIGFAEGQWVVPSEIANYTSSLPKPWKSLADSDAKYSPCAVARINDTDNWRCVIFGPASNRSYGMVITLQQCTNGHSFHSKVVKECPLAVYFGKEK